MRILVLIFQRKNKDARYGMSIKVSRHFLMGVTPALF